MLRFALPIPFLFASVPGAQCPVTSLASDSVPGDRYGSGLASDDDVLAVGAPTASPDGAVYVYRESGGTFAEEQKILGPPDPSGGFGFALDVDGDTLAVGNLSFDAPTDNQGAVFIYGHSAGQWSLETSLYHAGASREDELGTSVALDGGCCIAGAPGVDDVGPDAGAVLVFEKSGGAWSEVAKLLPLFGQPNGEFGKSLDTDGAHLLVSAPGETAAYVYSGSAANWQQVAKLVPSGVVPVVGFGRDVAIEGSVAVVTGNSSLRIFEDTPFGWVQVAAFSEADPRALDLVGQRIVLSFRSPAEIRVYEKEAGTWTLSSTETVYTKGTSNLFGDAVVISQGQVVTGDAYFDVIDPDTGTVVSINAGATISYDLNQLVSPLGACPGSLSMATGGSQELTIRAGADHIGEWYLVLGSLTGSTPGLCIGPQCVPLVPDAYLSFTLANANNPPPLDDTLGVLDGQGFGDAAIVLPTGMFPALVGFTMHHAYVTFDLGTLVVSGASNAVSLNVTP